MREQWGYGFEAPGGFDFGGQSGFDFSEPESQHSREERERRKRHQEEEFARNKRKREEWRKEEERQREQRERSEREKREREERERRERQQYSGGRARHQFSWEAAHEVLGVAPGASAKEVRSAWARMCKQHHPDVGGDVETLKRINAAYEQLKRGVR